MENKAATESSDPIKQILQLIEKKIRNLEKRKSRLDTIREKARDRDSKVELNEEQREAVEKYDGVVQNIEFAKELQKSVATIVTDHEKQQKKQQKKEKAERAAVEQKRFRELIDVQTLLDGLGEDKTRNDFLHGTHGATVISEADLTHLDNLYQLIRPSRDAATNYEQKVSEAAEHVMSLLDGRDRPVGGTTYQHLHQLVDQLRSSNYFTAKHNGTSHEPVASAVPANSQVTPDLAVSGHHGNEAPQVTHASGDSQLYAQPPAPVPHQAPPVSQPVFQAPARPLHDLVPASPFNFLQDSEIEPNDYVGSVYEKSVYPAGSYADAGVPGSTFVPHNIATSLAALNVTAQGKDTFVGEGQSDNFNMQSQTFVNSNTAASHQQDNAPGQPPFTGQFADNANGQVKAQDQHHHHGYHQGRGGRGGYRGGRGGYQQRDSEGEWQHGRQYNGGQYNNHQHNNYRGGYRGGNRGDGRRRDDRGARQPQSAMS